MKGMQDRRSVRFFYCCFFCNRKICETVMNTSKVTVDPRSLAAFENSSRFMGMDDKSER